MQEKALDWKYLVVIGTVFMITLVAVMTASGTITLGEPDGNGVNTSLGKNVTENVTMWNLSENFLNFTLNDSAGNITSLNLTFPSEFTLPANTSSNYTLPSILQIRRQLRRYGIPVADHLPISRST